MIKKVIYDTAANFTAYNWILDKGTQGIETDTGRIKEGDSSTRWTSLGYSAGGASGPVLMTTPVSTVSIREYGDGRDITSVLTLTEFVVGALAGAGAALRLGNIVAAYPAGAHLESVAYFSLSLKAVGTAVSADTGLGSVIATGASATLDGTATFEDRLTGQAVGTAAAGGTVVAAGPIGATAGIHTGIALNGASAVKNVFLNSAGTWNANNTGNLTANGTIVLKWTKMSV